MNAFRPVTDPQRETWLSGIPVAPACSSSRLCWEDIDVYRFDALRCWEFRLPPMPRHFIGVHLMGPCTVDARWSGRPLRARSVPGNTMLMSAGQDSIWYCAEAIDELHIFLEPRIVHEVAAEAGLGPVRLMDGIGLTNPAIRDIALQLLTEVQSPGVATRLFAATTARALALALLRCNAQGRLAAPVSSREMTTRQYRMATEHIEAHLELDLSLESIARAAGMSAFRFARGFRAACGQSPHQYVIARRMVRARELLRTTRLEIGEIAARVGFATQSHFTATFRRHCGTTPLRYRAGG